MHRLYTDENFPSPVVVRLRALGHDVVTAFEDGAANRAVPDDEVLRRAAALERALLTLNRRDFVRLHRQSADHRGIVVCTADTDFAALSGRIHARICEFSNRAEQLIHILKP